jgi:threonine dehydrogenase-like Zn-dependent dehydrogenase
MKAVVFHGVGDIRIDDLPEPAIQQPNDAIVRITASSICGTDLHMVRGTMGDMVPGTILGHEGVGVIEEIGPNVRNLSVGDRVVIASSIACGYCSYCRAGYFSQCDNANPNGPLAGTALFGGPRSTGPFNGLQAEYARVPYANVGLVRLPDEVDDDRAILLSDIFPTGYFGADLAEIKPGDTVAVFGCGPVGQFAIVSAGLMEAGRILAIDHVQSRLDMARDQGAEVINFDYDDPVETIRDLTGGIGVDRVIDAVGVEAESPQEGDTQGGPVSQEAMQRAMREVAPKTYEREGTFAPGGAPAQALAWEVEAVAKAGTIAIIGVYPPQMNLFPIGVAMNRNLTIRMGNCPHRRYIPMLLDLVESESVDPLSILTEMEPLVSAIEAYKAFDERRPGWLKVELFPTAAAEDSGRH